MNNKKEVIFYEGSCYMGLSETCEYISDKGILKSELLGNIYPLNFKEIKADENSLNRFWKKLDEINIWSWKKNYDNVVCDGHCWELSLRNKDGKAKHVTGFNMYPRNFQKFIDALNQLFQTKIEIEIEEIDYDKNEQ
jgi:hypothetical protein